LSRTHPARRLGPLLQNRDHVFALIGGDVERCEMQVMLRGRRDARLPFAPERDGDIRGFCGAGNVVLPDRDSGSGDASGEAEAAGPRRGAAGG
jgi:hypothetical protein